MLVAVLCLGETTSVFRTRKEALKRDRGSFLVFSGAQAVGYFIAFWLWGRQRLPEATAWGSWSVWVGAAVCLSGTALRVWSMRTLGRYFTHVVRVTPDQQVVQTGPYRLIRHPSYTGGALAALGIGISMGNALTALLLGAPFLLGAAVRIRVEEKALAETIGAPYREYMTRTKRLIPYVY